MLALEVTAVGAEPIKFTEAFHTYLGVVYAQPGTITVADPAGGRTLDIAAEGSANAVVWNPWVAKSAAMSDFGDDEWMRMVCVETCNVLDAAVTLAPGESHTMTARITAAPLPGVA